MILKMLTKREYSPQLDIKALTWDHHNRGTEYYSFIDKDLSLQRDFIKSNKLMLIYLKMAKKGTLI